MKASGLNDFLLPLQELPSTVLKLPGPVLFAASGLLPLGLRLNSYFTAQVGAQVGILYAA